MKGSLHIVLLDRFMKGETSPDEERELLAWFRTEEAKSEIMAFYRDHWQQSEGKVLSLEIQDRMLEGIFRKMRNADQKLLQPVVNKTRKRISFIRWVAVACISILIGVGISTYILQKTDPEPFIVFAEKGQKANIELPDGTRVWLNSDTKLTYDSQYNTSARNVFLEGEAYFEVSKDKEKPFVVNANGVYVEALGTSFNVKAYTTENQVTATLLEGKVRVSHTGSEVILEPNERAVYQKNDPVVRKNRITEASHVILWRDDELAFYGETLEEIGIVLERIYNVKIIFTSEEAKKHSFTGVIKNSRLNNVFEIIGMTAPIEYSINDSIIRVSERK